MRLKDLAAVLMAAASLVGSLAGLVTAFRAKAEVQAAEQRQDENQIHSDEQAGLEDLALREQLGALKQQIAALEAAGGRR